ncbi:MAG TPA: hypothetical protein VF167_16090 [Longimicrobiaceae bacterium]
MLEATGNLLRITPYEVAFADTAYESEVFPAIAADAQFHGSDPLRLEPFSMLPATSEAVRSFVPPEAPAEAVEQYRTLLYHGYNYWSLGHTTYLLHPAAARFLVEAQPSMEGWELVLPRPSFYIQLPQNLFWGSIAPDATPEQVDGMFVTGYPVTGRSGDLFQRLEVLMVLGLRRDRAGFSVIPFDTEAGPGIASLWADAGTRDSGTEFESVLPGGAMSGLYSLVTVGEVLKLLGRILWYIDTFPGDVSEKITSAQAEAGEEPRFVPVSRLPYRLITLGRDSGPNVP